MSESHDVYLELCAAHALGSLDAPDRERLEAHLKPGCPECEAALAAQGDAMVALALTAERIEPRPELKERILGAIPRSVEMPAAKRPAWNLVWGLAALAVVLLVADLVTWRQVSALRQERDVARAEVTRLEGELAEAGQMASLLSARDSRVAVLLPTTPEGPKGRGRAYLDPATGNAYLAFHDLERPSGRDFELWAIHGQKPTSLGVIQVDSQGEARVRLTSLPEPGTLNAFAVSLEPEGGSPGDAPTGPVILVGGL